MILARVLGAGRSRRVARYFPGGSWEGHGRRRCPSGMPMLHDDGGVDSAANVEFGHQTHEARRRCANQLAQDLVGHRLVKGAPVAERPDVQLQRFQLDAALIGDVFELESREVRLTGLRTQAGEFREGHPDGVVAFRRGIRKGLEGRGHRSAGVYECGDYFTLRATSTARLECRSPFQSRQTQGCPQPMRLTKLKIAGFKSFVDPTTVTFPSSLTGVVGPNGCGKSNIIDSVRWVMGEISAKHLRGESMADVIFNGSASRKPLGQASVELVFDNSEGKIGGPYASYNEVALKRAVSRDGTSDYFINGLKVRRKDITQLFLGTGLGTRSYAIIEQGMISRVIEAR